MPVLHEGDLQFISPQAAANAFECDACRLIGTARPLDISFGFVYLSRQQVCLVGQHWRAQSFCRLQSMRAMTMRALEVARLKVSPCQQNVTNCCLCWQWPGQEEIQDCPRQPLGFGELPLLEKKRSLVEIDDPWPHRIFLCNSAAPGSTEQFQGTRRIALPTQCNCNIVECFHSFVT